MSLTIGNAPFGPDRDGVFNFAFDPPDHLLYWEDSPRHVRAVFNGETVVDSRRVKMLHETGHPPVYYFPEADVRTQYFEPSEKSSRCPVKGEASYRTLRVGERRADDAVWTYPEPLEDAPPLAGHYAFYWNRMDAWYEEDDEVFVHPRDPYHRVDVRSSSRHVKVSIDGTVVAESSRPKLLFESNLPTRYYIPPEDVDAERLVDSEKTTGCPYKGMASYRSVRTGDEVHRDIAWYYPEPYAAVADITGHIAFYNEKVDIELDGEPQDRPRTRGH